MIRFDIHNEKIISRCAWMQPDMALGNDKAEISPDGKTGDPVWKVSKFNSSVLRGLTNKWNGHIGLNCGLFAEGKENELRNVVAHELSHFAASTSDFPSVFGVAMGAANYGTLFE